MKSGDFEIKEGKLKGSGTLASEGEGKGLRILG
jgi:hypothetical protein